MAQAKPLSFHDSPVTIGVSSCLLGKPVRYDGGHKSNEFVVDQLAAHARLILVCPEVELGLGTPRETLRLVDRDGRLRLIMKTGEDHTAGMTSYAARRVRQLRADDLDGYILKKDSPSCGLHRVKVYADDGHMTKSGRGLFASALVADWPELPVEDEGRLSDPNLRENFIERVFAYRRLKDLFASRWRLGSLVAFHTAHKFVLLSHDAVAYRALGRLVADARRRPRGELEAEYRAVFMRGLSRSATRARHTDVLSHMAGHFRGVLDDESRAELGREIESFRLGHVPLIVPVTLIRHHARRLGVRYLTEQIYLQPHPRELALRNHV
jgi:uncharacterized protein YbbK (DUF523 family)/uncharacterized protein YbgA (DUF1722 family)